MDEPAAQTRIHLHEVVTRDGFQGLDRFIPTEAKVALLDALSLCGISKIEVTSFVSPKAIPNLADADAVMLRIQRTPGVAYAVLVPNVRGLERALPHRPDEVNFVMSASETHNLMNLRMTRKQSLAELRAIVAATEGSGVRVQVSLSTTFGCPVEGHVDENEVFEWVQRFSSLGVDGITLADTTGMADPLQVRLLVGRYFATGDLPEPTLHFHNTRGLGLANVFAAVGEEATRFDASLGGLGGCPYAPGATGNICTEDAASMLSQMGFATGVDLRALLAASRRLPELVGRETPGQVAKAGFVEDTHPVPDWFEEVRAKALARG